MIILTRINFNSFLKKVKLVFTFFLLLSFQSFSQCKNVTASYPLPLGNKTKNVIIEEATNLAKLEALKKAFGASYQQTTSRQTIDTELNGVRNTTTSNKLNISSNVSGFFTLSKDPEVKQDINGDEITITVTVTGKACEKVKLTNVDFRLVNIRDDIGSEYPVKGIYHLINNDEKIIPYIKSSSDGYINIFYSTESRTLVDILEPTIRDNILESNNKKIQRNKEYYLSNFLGRDYVTELQPGNRQQIDKIYLVYSKKTFPLPQYNDSYDIITINLDVFEKQLLRWKNDKDFQVEEYFVQIRN